MQIKNLSFFILVFCVSAVLLSGCATVSTREGLPTYYIGGANYFPLISFCELKHIDWQYDTFTRAVSLVKDGHKINLRVGESMALVDGEPVHLRHPVDIYQGTIVLPYKFKEEVLDALFKEAYPLAKPALGLNKIRRVVIDAGHGGNDPGAVGRRGLKEKGINLDIARKLSNLLTSEGIDVVMTRNSDRFVPLSTRVAIANKSRADLFVSIHANANRVRSLSGFEIYYVAPSVNDSRRAYLSAKNLSLALDNASFASNSLDLKAILWDMIYTCNRAEAIDLSRSICRSINDDLGSKILGVKAARFEVLRGARMPAVLVEVGFLSNQSEENMLKNSYYRQKIAESIAGGIRDYAPSSALMEVKKG